MNITGEATLMSEEERDNQTARERVRECERERGGAVIPSAGNAAGAFLFFLPSSQ